MRLLVSGGTASLKRMVDAGHRDVLGHLLTPKNGNSVQSILDSTLPWACDNAAYSSFDSDAFRHMLDRVSGQHGLLWVACPDVVGNAKATLDMWHMWQPELLAAGVPTAFVLQDSQGLDDLPDAACYFLGGTTAWKLSEAAFDLAREAKRRGALLHMGRVNSLRRLRVASAMQCDSVDGTSMSRWGDACLTNMIRWVRQVNKDSIQQQLLW